MAEAMANQGGTLGKGETTPVLYLVLVKRIFTNYLIDAVQYPMPMLAIVMFYIYFIAIESDVSAGVKIGRAKYPLARLAQFQTWNPHKLTILHSLKENHLLLGERDLHAKFAHLRMHGEWFRAETELLTYIEQLKNDMACGLPPIRL